MNEFERIVAAVKNCDTDEELLAALKLSPSSPEWFYASAVWVALGGKCDG